MRKTSWEVSTEAALLLQINDEDDIKTLCECFEIDFEEGGKITLGKEELNR